MEKNIEEAIRSLYNHDFANSTELINTLFRVKITTKALMGNGDDTQIYQMMKMKTEDMLGYFPGDQELFIKLYHLLEAIDIFDFLKALSTNWNAREYGLQIPDVLMQWFRNRLEGSKYNKVLIPEAEHNLAGIYDIAKKYPDKLFTVTTREASLFKLLTLAYEDVENVEVKNANLYDVKFIEDKFDFIFSIPAFGGRNMVFGDSFICRELDLVAVENLLKRLSSTGTLLIVLPAKISFGGGKIARLRTFIEENYSIVEINEMPQGLFRPYAGVKTYLFEFTTGATETISISSYEARGDARHNTVEEMNCIKKRTISKAELDDLGDWRVELLLADRDENMEQYASSAVPKVKIKDVADVFRGKAVQKKSLDGNIAMINISDICESGIEYSNLDRFEEEERKIKRYELQTGDVLVTSRGTAIRTATFEAQETVCIASANLTVIRPGSKLDGKYLKIFLESPVGITLLKSFQRGTAIININHLDLMELSIPLPPLQQQQKIVETYEKELRLYQDTIEMAQTRWSKIKTDLYQEIY